MVQTGITRLRWLWTLGRQTPLALFATLALCLALVVQAVRLLFVLITPVGPVGDPVAGGPVAMASADRAALFGRVDPFYRSSDSGGAANGAVTGLALQLFGIRINEGAGSGSAIIADEDGQQNSIGVGEQIQPGVTLAAVHFDHVEIDNGGRRELLYMDQSVPTGTTGAPASPAAAAANLVTANTTANVVPAAPISPRSLRAGISWTARMEGNRATGIIVREQGDGSAFLAAGFRTGDIIRSVNGRAINSPSDIAALTNQLQPGARLSLEVERGAGTVPIAITIPAGNP